MTNSDQKRSKELNDFTTAERLSFGYGGRFDIETYDSDHEKIIHEIGVEVVDLLASKGLLIDESKKVLRLAKAYLDALPVTSLAGLKR